VTEKPPISQAVLLAAGFGTRLAPLSGILPKALFPVLNRPMLGYWLKKCSEAGVRRVAVNCHHKAEQIKDYLARSEDEFPELDIFLSYEPEILGTGGGVKKAAQNFTGPLWVINCDIYADIDLQKISRDFLPRNIPAVMAVSDSARPTVSIDRAGRIVGLREQKQVPNEVKRLFGLGIMAVSQTFRDLLPDGPSDIIEVLARYLDQKPETRNLSEIFWSDMGTPQSYWALNRDLSRNSLILASGAVLDGEGTGFVVMGPGSRVFPGARVQDSVIWSNADIRPGAVVKNAVVTKSVPEDSEVEGVWV
jgi:mannose-1-phosphate guanylyltransferase